MTNPHENAIFAFSVIVKLGIFVLTLVLFCSTSLAQKVKVKFRPGSDFSKYHSYKWAKVSHSGQVGTINTDIDEDVKRVVDAVMAKKRFTKVEDSRPADLLLVTQIAVKEKHQWVGLDPHHPASWMVENQDDTTVEVGTAVLDFYDSTGQLLWHGRATDIFDAHDNAGTVQMRTAKDITKLIEKFPPE